MHASHVYLDTDPVDSFLDVADLGPDTERRADPGGLVGCRRVIVDEEVRRIHLASQLRQKILTN